MSPRSRKRGFVPARLRTRIRLNRPTLYLYVEELFRAGSASLSADLGTPGCGLPRPKRSGALALCIRVRWGLLPVLGKPVLEGIDVYRLRSKRSLQSL